YHATRSWMMAAAAYVLAFRPLRFIGADPAHPQELCMLLALAFALTVCSSANPVRLAVWLGALTGAMAMTKINMGLLMAVAMGLVMAQGTRWPIVRWAAIAGAALFPWLLMAPLLSMTWAWQYLLLVELSLAAAVLVIVPLRGEFH